MIVTLIQKDSIHTLTLPEKVSGQYWLQMTVSRALKKDFIRIEGIYDQWILRSNSNVSIKDISKKIVPNAVLTPLSLYTLELEGGAQKAFIFAEPATIDRQQYQKVMIEKDMKITIGRGGNNVFNYQNEFVSSLHATLMYQNRQWHIRDEGSTNGTFVNKRKIKEKSLRVGDVVYIMGFKIIIGTFFLAFNNPDRNVFLNSDLFCEFIKQSSNVEDNVQDKEEIEIDYFYRSPRFKRDIEKRKFKVDPPPQSTIGDELPMMLLIGPSLTMGMASLTTGSFAVYNALSNGNISSAVPTVVMSSSMLLGTVLWPVLSKRYEKKRKKKKEALRQEKYKEYLDSVAVKLNEECKLQEEILKENHVSIQECVKRIENVQRNLWERCIGQNDFLKLRIGVGNRDLNADLLYAERKFTIDNDNLQEELYSLCESPKILNNVPITISLYEHYIAGIIGDKEDIKEFAKGLVFQLAAYYSYDEVKMVFLYDESEQEHFYFTKWLPHVWSNHKETRFLASNIAELKEISFYLEKEIGKRSQCSEQELQDISPYYVIFATSKKLVERSEILKQMFKMKKNLHMSFVACFEKLNDMPKECSTVIELSNDTGKLFNRNDLSGKSTIFKPDINVSKDAVDLSIQLANIPLNTSENTYQFPKLITFLTLFGVGKVEHLNALTRWKEHDPTKSLEAAVGVNAWGDVFKLDFHENYHGPHGLVAGMTGSGKSEFIMTFILSMALNYHPHEVAFILIDYKGGGMAKSFEKLPHTAGIITNLDGAAIKRSLVSIESELKRRQAIFAQASKQLGVSNIDIYKYQKLYREGAVEEPLQHLFIISDEFAELKTQQPEFMTQLVSAARIGRSLGIHLILATQKPSGVVDDQIWSNSRLRVCLKVQERSDSMDMIKRSDAADLCDTGRFYMQVGYNEVFEMGQCAWAGAPYYPSEQPITQNDDNISVIDRTGRVIRQATLKKHYKMVENPRKQLDCITDYLAWIAEGENIKVRSLWLEPIAERIYLQSLKKKYQVEGKDGYDLQPIIGEYDDPAKQRQCLMRLPLSKEGNAVIYGSAGAGKTSFLTTLTYSLISEYTPDEVNIYMLDFASETLRAFVKAPHVGDVMFSHDSEKISNLFKLLQKEMLNRKKRIVDYGGDFQSYNATTSEKLPSIIVMIHNYTAFTELYEEKEDALAYLSREGMKYGIYFVLTSLGTQGVRFRLLQNFKQMFVLQMNDESDYATILGKTDGLYPSNYKGRGLVKYDAIYEFQVASICKDPIPFAYIQEYCATLYMNWKGIRAKRVPVLPDKITLEFMEDNIHSQDLIVPIGIEKSTLDIYYYSFQDAYIHMLLANHQEYIDFGKALITLIAKNYNYEVIVFDIPQDCRDTFDEKVSYYAYAQECEQAIHALFDVVVYRHNTTKDCMQSQQSLEEFDFKFIYIHSIVRLKEVLSDVAREKLELLLEKGERQYNLVFVVAESVKKLSSLTFQKWYKKHVSSSDGIWIGNGISEQYHLKPSKMTQDMYEEVDMHFGFVLKQGKASKVKMITIQEDD